MNARAIARILGLVFLVIGVAGFLPFDWIAPAAPFDAPVVTLDTANRMLFGIFPVNAAFDIVHLILGAWGLLAAMSFGGAVVYCRCVALLGLILAFLGLIPLVNTLLGFAPIYGWDVALDFIIALLAAYGGFGRGAIAPQVPQAAIGD
jgi:hypothetical protein